MNLLRELHRKTFIGETVHALLNVLLALAVFGLVYIGDSAVLIAIGLVLLSKWRVFAVRPRYWWANILANIVDITVSLSMVILMYLASKSNIYVLQLQILVTVVYAIWLVAIKPRSKQGWVIVQSMTALFFGTWALSALAHIVPFWLIVTLFYVVGYGVTRHVLSAFDEEEMSLMSMVFGLVTAEVAWLLYHWNIAYGTKDLVDFRVPQMSLVMLALGLFTFSVFISQRADNYKSWRSAEVLAPTIFSVAVIFILLIFFSAHGPGII